MITGVATSVFSSVITFITNLFYLALTPIVNVLWTMFPNLDFYIDNIQAFFDFIFDFVIYAFDLSMITRPVWSLVILSIIYRISFSYAIFGIKLTVNWYHMLMI